jgi:trimethylamine:corrinoid methyltransferase-like protein
LNYKVTERRSLSAWQRDGAKNIKQRARERLDEKLKAYHPEPLSTDVQKELDGIIKEAGERLKKTSIQ